MGITKEELVKEIPCLNCLVMSKCIDFNSSTGTVSKPCDPFLDWKSKQHKLFPFQNGFFDLIKEITKEKNNVNKRRTCKRNPLP